MDFLDVYDKLAFFNSSFVKRGEKGMITFGYRNCKTIVKGTLPKWDIIKVSEKGDRGRQMVNDNVLSLCKMFVVFYEELSKLYEINMLS